LYTADATLPRAGPAGHPVLSRNSTPSTLVTLFPASDTVSVSFPSPPLTLTWPTRPATTDGSGDPNCATSFPSRRSRSITVSASVAITSARSSTSEPTTVSDSALL